MQLKTAPCPRVAMRVTSNQVRKLVQRRPLVIRAEEHLAGLGDHPTERMLRLAPCADVIMYSHPLQPLALCLGGACEKHQCRLPKRPSGCAESARRTNLKWEIQCPAWRLYPATSNLDARKLPHRTRLSLGSYRPLNPRPCVAHCARRADSADAAEELLRPWVARRAEDILWRPLFNEAPAL